MINYRQLLDKFNALKKREQYLVLGLVFAFIFSFYFNAIYKPMNIKLKKLKIEIKSIETKLSSVKSEAPQLEKEKIELNELKISYDKTRKRLYDVEDKLTNRERIPTILNELIKQGNAYNVDFVSIRPTATKNKTTYSKLEIEMKMNASYENFVNYLYRLENISKFLKPSSLELEAPKTGMQGAIKCRVILGTFLSERPAELVEEIKVPYLERLSISKSPFKSKMEPEKKMVSESVGKKYKLQGVNWFGGIRTAIINGEVYKIGDKIDEMYIKDISKVSVILKDKTGEEIVISIEQD